MSICAVVRHSSESHDANAGVRVVSIPQAVQDTRPRSPPSEAVKLTRSQMKQKHTETHPEPKSLIDGLDQEQTMKEETVRNIPVIRTSELEHANGNIEAMVLDAPTSPLPSAVPVITSNLRVAMPDKRSTSNKENVEPVAMESPQPNNYDQLEDAVVTASTPPRSNRDSSVRPEDQILALDELDEAVETVNKDIPEIQTSPEKPKSKKEASKKPAPVVRTTKAAAARISLAHGSKDAAEKGPALGRPSPSKSLARSSSIRQTSSSSNRVISTSSAKDSLRESNGEKKEVIIPHSKPRPVSMSFPTPPPPPKSTKAPTQSTFKLPGEAVAEKLRAAKEARMQREAEEEKKKPAFKARPVPSTLSKAPSIRQTNASKARESLMNGTATKRLSSVPSSAPAGHKRANSVATFRPTAPAPNARITSTTSTSTSKPPATNGTRPPLSAPKKRPSTAMAEMSKPRTSLAASTFGRIPSGSATNTANGTAPGASGKGTAKGKEVFNRAATAKAAADKEKAEKEEATRKARAEAAERSKLQAREWAEKQKRKLAKQAEKLKGEEPACTGAADAAVVEA